MKWKTISRNERSLTINGRHFFAARCNPKTLWWIEELNQAQINGSRSITVFAEKLKTRDVTAYFKHHPPPPIGYKIR